MIGTDCYHRTVMTKFVIVSRMGHANLFFRRFASCAGGAHILTTFRTGLNKFGHFQLLSGTDRAVNDM